MAQNDSPAQNTNLPKISVVIPTLNEEEHLGRCLTAIFDQDYPKELLEVFVVDGGSTDRTVEIAKTFPVTCLYNEKKLAEPAKTLGFLRSSGELFIYLDADLFLPTKQWFSLLVKPLLDDPEIVGSFTRFIPEKSDPAINRYLSYHEFSLDPLLQFLYPPLKNSIKEKRDGYDLCVFEAGKIPPVGICLYRSRILREVIKPYENYVWGDVDIPHILAKAGYHKFAYVEKAGMYHLLAKELREFLAKKKRNVTTIFLPVSGSRVVSYIDFSNPKDVFRIAMWVIYANTLVFPLIAAMRKILKYKDLACFYEFLTTPLATDYVIYLFLKDPKGRAYVGKFFNKFLGR